MRRRRFIASGLAALLAVRAARAQDTAAVTQTMFGPMDGASYLPVRLPARAVGARLSDAERDALEHDLKCQCGCTLDVYTCRTTDFTCPVSPAMHRDVLSLVAGGYAATEIREAFVRVYGERVLMAPVRAGFNWVGYLLPFAVIGAGATLATAIVRRWSRRRAVAQPIVPAPAGEVTADELSRIERAVREDA